MQEPDRRLHESRGWTDQAVFIEERNLVRKVTLGSRWISSTWGHYYYDLPPVRIPLSVPLSRSLFHPLSGQGSMDTQSAFESHSNPAPLLEAAIMTQTASENSFLFLISCIVLVFFFLFLLGRGGKRSK